MLLPSGRSWKLMLIFAYSHMVDPWKSDADLLIVALDLWNCPGTGDL